LLQGNKSTVSDEGSRGLYLVIDRQKTAEDGGRERALFVLCGGYAR
jgi:hypothetical protein